MWKTITFFLFSSSQIKDFRGYDVVLFVLREYKYVITSFSEKYNPQSLIFNDFEKNKKD